MYVYVSKVWNVPANVDVAITERLTTIIYGVFLFCSHSLNGQHDLLATRVSARENALVLRMQNG